MIRQPILLVEDEPNDVFFVQHAIEQAGVLNPVHVSPDGQDAIDYLNGAGKYTNRQRFPLPCLILLDLKLPRVMGLDVLKWIRDRPELTAIVIVLTSSRQDEDIHAAYRLGANAYLVKSPELKVRQETGRAIKTFWLTHNTPPPLSTVERTQAIPFALPRAHESGRPNAKSVSSEAITVLLADDHPFVRSGLRVLIGTAPDLKVIGEAEDGRQAVREALRLQPDVVIMDVAMPLLNGVDAARQIMREAPRVKVLILSSHDDEQRIEAALDAGVAGYLIKSTGSTDLLNAIRATHQGEACFSPAILEHVSKQWQKRGPNGRLRKAAVPALSVRQAEVLQLIAEGYSTKEIATVVGLSRRTIEKHRQSLMDKLDVHEISGLTRYAASHGMIELNTTPLTAAAFAASPRSRRLELTKEPIAL